MWMIEFAAIQPHIGDRTPALITSMTYIIFTTSVEPILRRQRGKQNYSNPSLYIQYVYVRRQMFFA